MPHIIILLSEYIGKLPDEYQYNCVTNVNNNQLDAAFYATLLFTHRSFETYLDEVKKCYTDILDEKSCSRESKNYYHNMYTIAMHRRESQCMSKSSFILMF